MGDLGYYRYVIILFRMKKQKKESYFWTSYSDLMTSLFLVMLVLFVSSYIQFSKANTELEARNESLKADSVQLAEIKKIQKSTEDLSKEYFGFNEGHKKFVLKVKSFFPRGKSDINYLSTACQDSLMNAGREIAKFLNNHSENKYLLIIEGQASADSELQSTSNYILSFNRAYNLMKFWEMNRIDFGYNCEIQIAGSGDGLLDKNSMRDEANNAANQRFLIHILPKNIIREEPKKKKTTWLKM